MKNILGQNTVIQTFEESRQRRTSITVAESEWKDTQLQWQLQQQWYLQRSFNGSGSKKKEGKGERAICLSARRKDEGDSSEREGPKF